jgi:dihydrodipicolinate synthase/N-acetylneuraminate lyase
MELLVLIDKLDDVMHQARPVPLTDQVRVDKEAVFEIIDALRAEVPQAIAQARAAGAAPAAGGIDRQAVKSAVSDAISERIPEIVAAVTSAIAARSERRPPPGGPF